MMSETYHAFLLRLRRTSPDAPLRITLSNPQTREEHHFANLVALVCFLDEQVQRQSSSTVAQQTE